MSRTLRFSMLTIGISALLLGFAAAATAAPSRAPHLLVGTPDCGWTAPSNSWLPRATPNRPRRARPFLSRSDGATGLFIPASLDLTFTRPRGPSASPRRGGHPGPVSCEIAGEPAPGFTLDCHGGGQDHLTG